MMVYTVFQVLFQLYGPSLLLLLQGLAHPLAPGALDAPGVAGAPGTPGEDSRTPRRRRLPGSPPLLLSWVLLVGSVAWEGSFSELSRRVFEE